MRFESTQAFLMSLSREARWTLAILAVTMGTLFVCWLCLVIWVFARFM